MIFIIINEQRNSSTMTKPSPPQVRRERAMRKLPNVQEGINITHLRSFDDLLLHRVDSLQIQGSCGII